MFFEVAVLEGAEGLLGLYTSRHWTPCLEVPGGGVVADWVHKPGIYAWWKSAGQDMASVGWQCSRVQKAAWTLCLGVHWWQTGCIGQGYTLVGHLQARI